MKKRLKWVAGHRSRPANRADSVRDEDTGVMAETILAMAGPKIVAPGYKGMFGGNENPWLAQTVKTRDN
jgi:hypothetical protein